MYSYINNIIYIYYIIIYHIILCYIILYYIILYYIILWHKLQPLLVSPRIVPVSPPSRPRMRKLLRRSAFTLWILLITLKQTHLKTASPQCTSTGNMLYLQCGAPSVISWFITPMNTIVIGIMNHSYCIEIINNLAIDWGPHPVPFWCNKKRPENRRPLRPSSGSGAFQSPSQESWQHDISCLVILEMYHLVI